MSEIFLGDFVDLLILFGLDVMGINALKIRVDPALRRSRGKQTLFLFIGLSHGDDVPEAVALRVDHDHGAASQPSNSDVSDFTID